MKKPKKPKPKYFLNHDAKKAIGKLIDVSETEESIAFTFIPNENFYKNFKS